MQNSDVSVDNIEEKLKEMNMTPDEVLQKLMNEPNLAQVHSQHYQVA